jgi:hypothetical protein
VGELRETLDALSETRFAASHHAADPAALAARARDLARELER